MTVSLSPELEDLIQEKVESGASPSVEAFVEDVVRNALGLNGGKSHEAKDDRPISEVIVETMKDVPAEEFAKLPKDGASQLDHYLYGHAKREQ